MKKLFTFTMFAEDKPGVLYRITDVFLRRKVNIEGIHSFKNTKSQLTKIIIFVEETEDVANKTLKQIEKVIEVVEAKTRVSSKTDLENVMKGVQNL